jgi:predicted transporter
MTLLGLLYVIAAISPIVMSLKACIEHPWWVWGIGTIVGVVIGFLNIMIWRMVFRVFEQRLNSRADSGSELNSISLNLIVIGMIAWVVFSVAMSSEIMHSIIRK